MNLINVQKLKKVKTFFNKFIPAPKKSSSTVELEIKENSILHTIKFGDLRISTNSKFSSISNYSPFSVNFKEWGDNIDNCKDEELQILPIQVASFYYNTIKMGTVSIDAQIQDTKYHRWNQICQVSISQAINDAISIANGVTASGKLYVNNRVFFHIQNNKLCIINTNDVVLNSATVETVIGDDFIFAIENSYINKLKAFLNYGSNTSDLNIMYDDGVICFSYETKDFCASFECPMDMTAEAEKTCVALEHLINRKWRGVPVTLDINSMYQEGLEDQIAWYIKNKKDSTKLTPKFLKEQLDKFTIEPNKLLAYKAMDKAIDLPYLSLNKSLGVKDLYIHRIMYGNYMAGLGKTSYSVYFLSTNAEALMFGGNCDDEMKFKTLFMLRKPAEPIAELTDDELEQMNNAEEKIDMTEDEDTFVPT